MGLLAPCSASRASTAAVMALRVVAQVPPMPGAVPSTAVLKAETAALPVPGLEVEGRGQQRSVGGMGAVLPSFNSPC